MKQPSEATVQDAAEATAPSRPTHLQAIALVVAIILVFGAEIAVLASFGNLAFWAPTLFYIYWTSFEQRAYHRIPASLAGAGAGLGMAYLLVLLPATLGTSAGYSVALAVITVAVYCLIMGWLPLIINLAAMLFLTVCGIPAVLHHTNFLHALIALVCGGIYLCAVTKAAEVLISRRSAHATEPGGANGT